MKKKMEKGCRGIPPKKKIETCLRARNVFVLLLLGNPGEKKKRRWREREKEDGEYTTTELGQVSGDVGGGKAFQSNGSDPDLFSLTLFSHFLSCASPSQPFLFFYDVGLPSISWIFPLASDTVQG